MFKLGSNTEWAPFEKLPCHSGEDRRGQIDNTDQAANLENFRQRAKFKIQSHALDYFDILRRIGRIDQRCFNKKVVL